MTVAEGAVCNCNHHIILEIGLVRELQKSSLQTNFMD